MILFSIIIYDLLILAVHSFNKKTFSSLNILWWRPKSDKFSSLDIFFFNILIIGYNMSIFTQIICFMFLDLLDLIFCQFIKEVLFQINGRIRFHIIGRFCFIMFDVFYFIKFGFSLWDFIMLVLMEDWTTFFMWMITVFPFTGWYCFVKMSMSLLFIFFLLNFMFILLSF